MNALKLSQTYTLTTAQISEFQKHGHILLRQVASGDEIVFFRPIIHQVSYKYNSEMRKLEERDTYGKAFLQTTNLWQHDEDVKQFVFAKRFAQLAADLLGVEKVRLYHDQALYKEPKGGYTPWHQDQYYWPLDTDKTITMWMPLIDITEEMGMLTFASGSHRERFIEHIAISDKSEAMFSEYVSSKGFAVTKPKFMKAGDATFHSGRTLHSAGGNSSETITREVMTIIYFADGANVTPSQNENQEADRLAWLGGLDPGEKAMSVLNPILN